MTLTDRGKKESAQGLLLQLEEAKRGLLEYQPVSRGQNIIQRHPWQVVAACVVAGFLVVRLPATRGVALRVLRQAGPSLLPLLLSRR